MIVCPHCNGAGMTVGEDFWGVPRIVDCTYCGGTGKAGGD